MSERISILLPEVDDPSIKAFHDWGQAPDNIVFKGMDMPHAIDALNKGKYDALVMGAGYTSAKVISAGIHEVGIKPGEIASSFFMMEKPGEHTLYYADCAVNISPDRYQLVQIAEQTCESVRKLGDTAVVAFLSYSTEGSSETHKALEMKLAAELFARLHPEIETYGEIQFDAAFDPQIYAKKTGKEQQSAPNVFIFPDLNSGNIAYKITEQLGGYDALGPLLQGFARPIYDLSRGVSVGALARICEVVNDLNQPEVLND